MADRPGPRTRAKAPSRGRKRAGGTDDDVIDVGDSAPAEGEDEEKEEKDEDAEDEPDEQLAADAPAVIDVSDDEEPVDSATEAEVEERAYGRGGRVGLIKRDPMQAYMQEVRRYPLLTPEEEHALAVRLVEHGDSAAARSLVEANLRLVVKIAYEYRRAHKNLLDLVQEGNIGLMQAVRKYDPYRGVKLSSYAAFWIRAYILKFILNNWRLVKIGTTQAQRKLFFNLRKERERLEQLGFQATTKLLAENLQVSEKEVVEMEKRLAAPEASLDAPMPGDEDGGRSRLDFVPSDTVAPDKAVADSEFAALFNAKLDAFEANLEGRELTIFRDRWRTDPPKTLQEIGDHYGVSRERARQLEKRVLDRLRKYLRAELGSDVDIDSSRD